MRRFAPILALMFLGFVSACRKHGSASLTVPEPNRRESAPLPPDSLRSTYDTEQDWSNPDHVIPLNYEQSQGKRLFYAYCVWCHADSTPAGPSNRANLTPNPHLINDGTALNALSDQYMEDMIALGGSALGKSAMMPPYGKSLDRDQIRALIAYMRAVAQPPYQKPARPGPSYERR